MRSIFKHPLKTLPMLIAADLHKVSFSKNYYSYSVLQLSIVRIDNIENFVIWPMFLPEGRPDRNS